MEEEAGTVPWIVRGPRAPVTVSVRAGEVLYLPKLWHHQVTQTTRTLAVNTWYEMPFDDGVYATYQLLRDLRGLP